MYGLDRFGFIFTDGSSPMDMVYLFLFKVGGVAIVGGLLLLYGIYTSKLIKARIQKAGRPNGKSIQIIGTVLQIAVGLLLIVAMYQIDLKYEGDHINPLIVMFGN